MKNSEYKLLELNIEQIEKSSARTRSVFIMLIISCLVIFSSVWNNLPNSWHNSFINTLKQQDAMPFNEKEKNWKDLEPEVFQGMTDEESKNYIQKKISRAEDSLSRYIDQYVKGYTDVGVPGVGIKFHSNDIGLLGGFSLVIILIWLWSCMRSENSNYVNFNDLLESSIDEKNKIKKIIATTQVFGSAGFYANSSMLDKVFSKAYLVVIWLPVFVHGFSSYAQLKSFIDGYQMNPSLTINNVVFCSIFFVIIILLCTQCSRESINNSKLWITER